MAPVGSLGLLRGAGHQDFQGVYTIMHQVHGHMPQGRPRPKMVHMRYLLTTVVDFSSETCPILVSIVTDDHWTSFRTEIDHSGQ